MTTDEKKVLADQIRNTAAELNALLNHAHFTGLSVRAWNENDPRLIIKTTPSAPQIQVEIKEVTTVTY